MALNTFSSGVNTSFSSQLNNNFNAFKVQQVYTSTGFDAYLTTSTASSTATAYELTAIPSSSLTNADYVLIELSVATTTIAGRSSSNAYANGATVQVEIKQTGLSYSTLFSSTQYLKYPLGPSNTDFAMFQGHDVINLKLAHPLTASQRSNGVQIKVTGIVVRGGTVAVTTTGGIKNISTLISVGA